MKNLNLFLKKRSYFFVLALFVAFLVSSCGIRVPQDQASTPNNIEFIILQLNDVYEISPLEGGKAGGMARVAQLKKDLLKENPNTIAMLAGDFLSPSFIGTLKMEDGEKVAGLHMVEALNAAGMDYVTFGNHEFDLKDPELLQKRMDQSDFLYTVCNATYTDENGDRPFRQNGKDIPEYLIHEFSNGKGDKVKVGILGVVIPFNKQDYVKYTPVTESFRKTYEILQSKTDMVIGLTHLYMHQDVELAKAVPGIPLFVGGHDHNNMTRYVENTIITKADANAKTVYIHRITYNPVSKMSRIRSTLKKIDNTLESDAAADLIVEKWESQVGGMVTNLGFEMNKKIMEAKTQLECIEADIRTQQTNFGTISVEATEVVMPGADLYFINSGSMRIDDNIFGTVTEYDILRAFPFGGPVVQTELPGKVLKKVLGIGLETNKGEGGYFQVTHVEKKSGKWMLRGKAIDDSKKYKVVLPQFVAQGREGKLELFADYKFETPADFKVKGQTVRNDIRDIVIYYMETLGEY